jgi:toxin ParE1/3/4
MRIVFHPQARSELIEAAQYYEEKLQGLGLHFLVSVDEALENLQKSPFLHPADEKARRKWRIQRFPYHFVYKVGLNLIFILAVAHSSRKPGYWTGREE